MRGLDVLVVGSTGRQGGAVAQALLRGGHHVRALTRNLAHPAANALRLRGARLAWANLDDERRLREAVSGADAVFAVTTSTGAPGTEARHGLLLAELARQEGVAHFVYSSSTEPPDSLLSGEKHEVEQYLRTMLVPHTILRPALLMENLLADWARARLERGELALPVPPSRKLQQLALPDLGHFVRLVMERRAEFLGRRIAIASDELTPIEMAATLARVLGRSVRCAAVGLAQLQSEDAAIAAAFEGLTSGRGSADVAALRHDFAEVNWHTLDGWARRQDWARARAAADMRNSTPPR